MRRSQALALLAAPLLQAAPLSANAAAGGPRDALATAAVAYARALGRGDYATSYAMLSAQDQHYYRTLENYASVFKADRFSLKSADAVSETTVDGAKLVLVRENGSFYDHGLQRVRDGRFTVPIPVVREGGAWRVRDGGHPYRALLPEAGADNEGVRCDIRKVSLFPRRIEIVATFTNHGEGFVTLLPYRRSTLRDQDGAFRLFETRDWRLTDRTLFLGLRLAASARYTGVLNFEAAARLDGKAHEFTLTIAPGLREGAEAPFQLALPAFGVSAS